jgi:hypothetical protein
VCIYYRRCKVAGTIKITRKVDIEIYPIELKKKKQKKKMATGPDFPSQAVDPVIESSILGKRPQPPSPAPSATLQTSSPARVGGLFGNFKSPPAQTSLFDRALASPAPSPDVDWEAYFRSFETALAALKLDHAETPRFVGTMLTGLQSLLRDEKVSPSRLMAGLPLPTYSMLSRRLRPWLLLAQLGLLIRFDQSPSLMLNGPR